MQGKFINLAGPTAGVGKSAVMAELARRPELNLSMLKTYTTRPTRRLDPTDANHYHFVSPDEFLKLKKAGRFFETKRLLGHWYGSVLEDIETSLSQGKNVISVVDAQRINKFKAKFPDMIAIFLEAPDKLLKERMERRGQSSQEIAARLKLAARERSFKKYYDAVFEATGETSATADRVAAYLKSRLYY